MLGIIVADAAELTRLPLPLPPRQIGQFRVYEYIIDTHPVVLLVAGIGPVNAAAATQALIMARPITRLYNFGSAGAYGGDLRPGMIVLPARAYFHDVVTPWYPRGHMPGAAPYYDLSVPAALAAAYSPLNLATGSSFMTDAHFAATLATAWGVHVYDMEAAAIAHIAAAHRVPLTVVKCVSDLVGANTQMTTSALNARLALSGAKAYDLVRKIIGLYANA